MYSTLQSQIKSLYYTTHSSPKCSKSLSLFLHIAMDPSRHSNEEVNSADTHNNTDPSADHDNYSESLGHDLVGIMDMLASFSDITDEFDQHIGEHVNNEGGVGAFMEDYFRSIPRIEELGGGGRRRDIPDLVTEELRRRMMNDNILREEEEEDPRPIIINSATRPASESSIQGLEKVNVAEEKEKGKCECSICFEDFSNDPEASRMPCLHVFHTTCIHGWLHTCNTCPLCRFQLPTDDEN